VWFGVWGCVLVGGGVLWSGVVGGGGVLAGGVLSRGAFVRSPTWPQAVAHLFMTLTS